MQRRNSPAFAVALGGVLAALAVVIMCMGGLIPVATFLCPIICMLLLEVIRKQCGSRIAWTWYAAVALLSLLLGPDKEAAAVFLFLGFYPIVKPKLDRKKLSWLWKLLLFNGAIGVMYLEFLRLFQLEEMVNDYQNIGAAMAAVMLVLGNLTFLLLDALLSNRFRR